MFVLQLIIVDTPVSVGRRRGAFQLGKKLSSHEFALEARRDYGKGLSKDERIGAGSGKKRGSLSLSTVQECQWSGPGTKDELSSAFCRLTALSIQDMN